MTHSTAPRYIDDDNVAGFYKELLSLDSKQLRSSFEKLSTLDQKIALKAIERIKNISESKVLLSAAEKTAFNELERQIHRIDTTNTFTFTHFVRAIIDGVRILLSKVFPERKKCIKNFLRVLCKQVITQSSLQKILKKLEKYKKQHPSERVNLSDFLVKNGYSRILEGLNFTIKGLTVATTEGIGVTPLHGREVLQNVSLDGVQCKNCDFSSINLKGADIKNCSFEACNFHKTVFYGTNITNNKFSNCQFIDAVFDNASIKDTRFQESSMQNVSFLEAKISHSTFDVCTLDSANFLLAKVDHSQLSNCDLENCLLFETYEMFTRTNCTQNVISKPIVALARNVEKPGYSGTKIINNVRNSGAIVLQFNFLPSDIDPVALDREVKQQVADIRKVQGDNGLGESLPIHLIKNARSDPSSTAEMGKLHDLAKVILTHSDALLLPGGADIEPEFYGQSKEKLTQTEADYRRTILEFSLIYQAREMGIPYMGICRGAQIGNVYHGGTLKQYVKGQEGTIQKLTVTPINEAQKTGVGTIRSIAKQAIWGMSIHHQASQVIGKDLEHVLKYKKIIKGIEGTQGAPMTLLQFHPEFKSEKSTIIARLIGLFLSDTNKLFFSSFVDAAKTFKNKKAIFRTPGPKG